VAAASLWAKSLLHYEGDFAEPTGNERRIT
jgi:hypothetical protein